MKKQTAKKKRNTSVEFGVEFADINAAKQYEIPFMNQKKDVKKK